MGFVHAWHDWEVSSTLSSISSILCVFEYTQLDIHMAKNTGLLWEISDTACLYKSIPLPQSQNSLL